MIDQETIRAARRAGLRAPHDAERDRRARLEAMFAQNRQRDAERARRVERLLGWLATELDADEQRLVGSEHARLLTGQVLDDLVRIAQPFLRSAAGA